MSRHLFWLSDESWARIEPHLPRGKPRVDDRRVISGILHALKTGCRWRDAPEAYRPPTTHFTTASTAGPRAASGAGSSRRSWRPGQSPAELSIDSSPVKAHRSAAGGPRKPIAWPMIAADRPASR